MKIETLLARMGTVRLIDMINGYPILTKINAELGEELISIEMSGNEIKDLLKAMPLSIRDRVKAIEAVDADDEEDTIAMIDKALLHKSEIAERSAQVVESNLRSIIYVSLVLLTVLIVLFRVYVGDTIGSSGLQVEGFLFQIVKMIYEQQGSL